MTRTSAPRLFQWLLALFPKAFREVYGADMSDVFVDQLRATRARSGRAGVMRLWLRTSLRMTAAAMSERRAARATRRGRLPLFDDLVTDLRLTRRSLLHSPLFTVVAVGALSLGVGAVATIFSSMNAIVLRPLPGTTDGAQLVGIDRRSQDWSEGVSASYNFYRYISDRAQSLDGVAVWSRVPLTIAAGGQNLAVGGNIVSPNYFDVLGVRPAAGRFFATDTSHLEPVVVVSHRFWRSRLAANPDALGQTVTLNGRPYRLIGVAAEGFSGVFTPLRVDAWVTSSAQPHIKPGRDLADAPWLWMFGRLADGANSDRARTELAGLTATWAAGGSDTFNRYNSIRLVPLTGLPDDARKAILGFGGMLLGAAVLVLMIAGANVSSLFAARATSKQREMGLRTALGARRGRLVRQLLTESLTVFALGAGGGVLVAWAATSALERLPIPGDTGLFLELSPDLRVCAFALLVSLVAGLAFGLGPALRGAGHAPGGLLRASSRGSSGRRSRLTKTLIVGQLAGSLVLLAVAGVFIRALSHGATVDIGFSVDNVSTAAFTTEAYGFDEAQGKRFFTDLRRRLESAPGVTHVSFSNFIPLAATASGTTITVNGARTSVRSAITDTGYFTTLGVPLLAGRDFATYDTVTAPTVAIVNDTFAAEVWPNESAVGNSFAMGEARVTVVGVVRSIKHSTLDEADGPFAYFPMSQKWQSGQTVFVRTTPGSTGAADAIRAAVREAAPHVPVPTVTTLADETTFAVFPQRIAAIVTGVLGASGLLLASAGLYGVLAFVVSTRSREIGVRMALGARPSDVLQMVVRDGLRMAGIGVVIGLAGAAAATRVASAYLLGARAFDIPTFAAVAVILFVVAGLASYLPARRAASTDPLNALRAE